MLIFNGMVPGCTLLLSEHSHIVLRDNAPPALVPGVRDRAGCVASKAQCFRYIRLCAEAVMDPNCASDKIPRA